MTDYPGCFLLLLLLLPLYSHELWPNEITCSKMSFKYSFDVSPSLRLNWFVFHFILKLCFTHSFYRFLACLFINTKRIMVTCKWKSFQNCCSTLKLCRKEISKKTEFCLINLLNRGNELWVEYLFYDRMLTMLRDRNKIQR